MAAAIGFATVTSARFCFARTKAHSANQLHSLSPFRRLPSVRRPCLRGSSRNPLRRQAFHPLRRPAPPSILAVKVVPAGPPAAAGRWLSPVPPTVDTIIRSTAPTAPTAAARPRMAGATTAALAPNIHRARWARIASTVAPAPPASMARVPPSRSPMTARRAGASPPLTFSSPPLHPHPFLSPPLHRQLIVQCHGAGDRSDHIQVQAQSRCPRPKQLFVSQRRLCGQASCFCRNSPQTVLSILPPHSTTLHYPPPPLPPHYSTPLHLPPSLLNPPPTFRSIGNLYLNAEAGCGDSRFASEGGPQDDCVVERWSLTGPQGDVWHDETVSFVYLDSDPPGMVACVRMPCTSTA